MNRTILASTLAVTLGLATSAQAAISNFDLLDGNGNVLAADQNTGDWNTSGSGVAIGIGPFGTPFNVGDTFQFLYQANLVTIVPDGAPTGLDDSSNGIWNLNKTFEVTIALNLYEEVSFFDETSPGIFNAQFVRDSTKVSTLSMFFGTPSTDLNASTAGGTGFDDGTEILRMTITDGIPTWETFSEFNATSTTTGQGSSKIYAQLASPGDFVNPNFLVGIEDFIFDVEFESTLNYPPGSSNTNNFHIGGSAFYPNYVVQADNIVFKVDASNQFSAVPEPTPILLLGLGLSMLGIFTRRGRRA